MGSKFLNRNGETDMSGSFVYKILSILKYSGSASSPISLLTAEELEKIFYTKSKQFPSKTIIDVVKMALYPCSKMLQ